MILVVDDEHENEKEHEEITEIDEKVDIEPKHTDEIIVNQSATTAVEDDVVTTKDSDLNNDDLGKYFMQFANKFKLLPQVENSIIKQLIFVEVLTYYSKSYIYIYSVVTNFNCS